MGRVILLLALFGLLSACAPISEDACRAGNWRGIGISDGTNGLPASTVGKYAETCAEFGIAPDLTAYQAGRAEGLKTYCTPDNAYQEGRQGDALRSVCPAAIAPQMQAAHRHGKRYHDITEDMDRIRERIDNREQILDTNFSGTLTPAQQIEAASIRAEIRSLDNDLFRLRIKRRQYETWP